MVNLIKRQTMYKAMTLAQTAKELKHDKSIFSVVRNDKEITVITSDIKFNHSLFPYTYGKYVINIKILKSGHFVLKIKRYQDNLLLNTTYERDTAEHHNINTSFSGICWGNGAFIVSDLRSCRL